MSLDPLLRPRSIAVIGASDVPSRIGGMAIDLCLRGGFNRIYPVNPKQATIQGQTCYPDIESVPEVVDLVIVAVSADATLDQLKRCHARGIRAALLYAAGYAETNEAVGAARQAELEAFARASGMKIAGPNAMGNANYTDGLFTTFGQSTQPGEPAGNTAMVTQSGNMCSVLFRFAKRSGVTFSHIINTGNEAVVGMADYLNWLADDPATTSAICYVEAIRDGPGFLAAAQKFRAAGKLLALFKVGASEKGAEAARSHTAALAGNEAAYNAAIARAGAVRASSLTELADLAYLHQLGGKLAGSSSAIMSISGAAGAILADALTLCGAKVPTLPEAVQAALDAQIPGKSMVSNPVDLTGNMVNSDDFLSECIRLALSPEDIDLLLLYTPGYFIKRAIGQVEAAAAASSKAIIVIDTFAEADREALAAKGIGLFEDFDRAARAVASYGKWKRLARSNPSPEGKRLAKEWPPIPSGRAALSETEAKEALARFGVPVVHDALVHSLDQARAETARIGFPLVAKLVSAEVAHKTEHGLIRLGLASADAVAAAYSEMVAKADSMGVTIDGVTLEPMLQGGVEVLAGVTRDPVFGWMLTVGLGGVWTELMQDSVHALLPLDAGEAEAMLRRLKGYKLLDGYRGTAKADIVAAAQAIYALCDAALAAGPAMREIEVNPLLILPSGQGAVALDALVLLKE